MRRSVLTLFFFALSCCAVGAQQAGTLPGSVGGTASYPLLINTFTDQYHPVRLAGRTT